VNVVTAAVILFWKNLKDEKIYFVFFFITIFVFGIIDSVREGGWGGCVIFNFRIFVVTRLEARLNWRIQNVSRVYLTRKERRRFRRINRIIAFENYGRREWWMGKFLFKFVGFFNASRPTLGRRAWMTRTSKRVTGGMGWRNKILSKQYVLIEKVYVCVCVC